MEFLYCQCIARWTGLGKAFRRTRQDLISEFSTCLEYTPRVLSQRVSSIHSCITAKWHGFHHESFLPC